MSIHICSHEPIQLVNTYQNDKMLHAMTQKSRKEIESCNDPFGNVRFPFPTLVFRKHAVKC